MLKGNLLRELNLETSNSPLGLAGCGDRRHGTGSPVNLPNWLPCEPFRLDGDLIRFSICPVMPFRLDLTVWALRRRSMNAVDLWLIFYTMSAEVIHSRLVAILKTA